MDSASKQTQRSDSAGLSKPLRTLLLTSLVLSVGAWTLQWAAGFPVPSLGSSATAAALIVGLLISVVATPFAIYRLVRFPATRTIGSYALTSICLALLLLGLTLGAVLLSGM